MSRNLTIILTGLAAFLVLILVVAFILLLPEVTGGGETVENTATPSTEEAATEVAAVEPTDTAEPTDLPAPAVQVLETDTPEPSATPTDTPEATATPEATDTPEPTPTNTPVPAAPVFVPTNTPVPPTAAPTPTAVPQDTHGLTGGHFALLPDSQYVVNGNIWYEFAVQNNSGGPIPYEALGALPRKDGVDRGDLFKRSWGGNNDVIQPGGLNAEDWIKLPEPGNYTLRLAICFDALASCQSGAAPWVTLSQEIPVTIN